MSIILGIVIVVGVISCGSTQNVSLVSPPQSTSEMGMRKFFNYEGNRYAILDSEYSPDKVELGKELGVLKIEMVQGDMETLEADFATTFGVGGKIYEIRGYNKGFRVLLEHEGSYYMAENVGKVSGEVFDLKEYFDVSNLIGNYKSMAIHDPMTRDKAKDVEVELGKEILEEIKNSSTKDLTDDEYMSIASAQTNGDFGLIVTTLKDGSYVEMFIMPELGYISVGDETFKLSDNFKNIAPLSMFSKKLNYKNE